MKTSSIILGSSLILGTVLCLSLVSWNTNTQTKKTSIIKPKNEIPDTTKHEHATPFWDLGKHFSGKGGCEIPEFNFYYGISTRFMGISKKEIKNAKSFEDFMINPEYDRINEIHSLNLIFVVDDELTDKQTLHSGNNISDKQRQTLLEAPLSTNFVLKAHCTRKKRNVEGVEKTNYTPYRTIVPETQASYEGGFDQLLSYFKDNSQSFVQGVDRNKLTPAKIYFTVNASGLIENIKFSNTTSYPEIDKGMLELVKNMPLKWTPAMDENGNKVSQELVYSFAVEGC
jgi:hypothetical protein